MKLGGRDQIVIFVVDTQDVKTVLVRKKLMEVKYHGLAIVMRVTGIGKYFHHQC